MDSQKIAENENDNKFGMESILSVKTGLANHRTIIEDAYFTAPFKIVRPFYDHENNVAEIMVMCASAGVMEGDSYTVTMDIGNGSAAALLGQSYTKIHGMNSGHAVQKNYFTVGENAFFDYNPKPSIPFAGSDFTSATVCHLKKGSRYVYSEILACGREKSGEKFSFRRYASQNRVYYCGRLIFLDNQLLKPDLQEVDGMGYFENYTHQATLVYFCDSMDCPATVERLWRILEQFGDIEAGISNTYQYGIAVKILACRSDYLERITACLRKEIYGCRPITAAAI